MHTHRTMHNNRNSRNTFSNNNLFNRYNDNNTVNDNNESSQTYVLRFDTLLPNLSNIMNQCMMLQIIIEIHTIIEYIIMKTMMFP